jgi:hypothetical protein
LKLVAMHAITMNVLALLAVALGASLIFLHGGGIVDAVTAAFIVGLLVAGAALIAMRPKWLPLAAWIVALVLIAYAIVPLLAALVQGEGFSVALATNAPFPQFPFWLRGAYVASSMLLPLGAIWALAGCVAAVRARPAQAGRLLAFALAMVFAAQASGVVATATGAPTLVALESQSASGATPADANAALAGLQIPNDATADSAADATLAMTKAHA